MPSEDALDRRGLVVDRRDAEDGATPPSPSFRAAPSELSSIASEASERIECLFLLVPSSASSRSLSDDRPSAPPSWRSSPAPASSQPPRFSKWRDWKSSLSESDPGESWSAVTPVPPSRSPGCEALFGDEALPPISFSSCRPASRPPDGAVPRVPLQMSSTPSCKRLRFLDVDFEDSSPFWATLLLVACPVAALAAVPAAAVSSGRDPEVGFGEGLPSEDAPERRGVVVDHRDAEDGASCQSSSFGAPSVLPAVGTGNLSFGDF